MRIARVSTADGPRYASVEGDRVQLLQGSIAKGFTRESVWQALPSRLLPPVVPSKVVAVASNYPKHNQEMGRSTPGEPRLFLKPSTAVIGHGDAIHIPPRTERVDPEGELAVVIGHQLSQATPEQAMKAVFGYTCCNDVTCRDFQKIDRIFGRAKTFDTFCPLGPWIETDLDPMDLAIETVVNGAVRAGGRTSEMIFDVPTLLSFISNVMTLLPGDVVTTGTPPGVAPIAQGDEVVVTIQGIGSLCNPVVNRNDRT